MTVATISASPLKAVKAHSGADYALAYLGLVVGLLFSADPGVELVDIMNNS